MRARQTKDLLGKGIEDGIIDTIVGLWANGITTHGSCEGHVKWGRRYPWVDVGVPFPEPHKKAKNGQLTEKQMIETKVKNQRLMRKLYALLKAYNANKVPYDERIILAEPNTSYGHATIVIQGSLVGTMTASRLAKYKKRLKHFAVFLQSTILKRT